MISKSEVVAIILTALLFLMSVQVAVYREAPEKCSTPTTTTIERNYEP